MAIRFRFSVRALLVLVTLTALYFGCWEMTERWGVELPRASNPDSHESARLNAVLLFDSSPAPFVISRLRLDALTVREYHLWFFGLTAKLPFEREIGPPPLIQYDLPRTL